MDFIRSALKEETKESHIQAEYIKQQQHFHGARSYAFVSDYYHDRQDKQLYVDENLYAQGYDKDAFLNMLAKEKGTLNPFISNLIDYRSWSKHGFL